MFRELLKKAKDLNIRNKLFITYFGLVTVPILFLLSANLYYSSRQSEQQARYTINQILNQTKSNLEFKTESISNLLNILTLNSTLQEMTLKSASYYSKNIGKWMVDDQDLTKALYFTFENPNITALHFYMKEGLAAAATTNEYLQLDSVKSTDWYKRFKGNGFDLSWFKGSDVAPENGSLFISAVKGMAGNQSLSDIIGVVRIDTQLSIFKTALDQSLFTKSSSALLTNSSNEIFCSTGNLPTDDINIIARSITDASVKAEWLNVEINNQEYLVASKPVNFTDWNLTLIVPYKDIQAYNINSRNQIMLTFLIIAPLTLPLSLLVSNSATKRIRKLITQMRKVEHGNFDITVLPGNHDEIGQLTQSFNFMLKKMEGLMDEKFQLGREMKNLEIKALQAQINPHFLYNTLDLINWMSIRSKAPEISYLVTALGKFYKLSLSRGEDIVTIGNELEHVKCYVQIQNMRFNNNMSLIVDVPEEMLNYSIVKLVLQPIVENAILHGIQEKDEEKGTIRIYGCIEGNTISICIQDDGVGITDERIHEILTGESTHESHGYGVHNINERLKLNYGGDYGLSFVSVVGKYTIATVKIPATLFHKEP